MRSCMRANTIMIDLHFSVRDLEQTETEASCHVFFFTPVKMIIIYTSTFLSFSFIHKLLYSDIFILCGVSCHDRIKQAIGFPAKFKW